MLSSKKTKRPPVRGGEESRREEEKITKRRYLCGNLIESRERREWGSRPKAPQGPMPVFAGSDRSKEKERVIKMKEDKTVYTIERLRPVAD